MIRIPLKTDIEEDKAHAIGALSGLWFEGKENDAWIFSSLTDRGPNAEMIGEKTRPFFNPNFQPKILRIKLDVKAKHAEITNRIPLWLEKNRAVSGLPNDERGETATTLQGQLLALDPNGIDPEAIVHDSDGTFWLAEEYGPSLVHFSADGLWLERYIPKGFIKKGMIKTKDILPAHFASRRVNRGFEALASDGEMLFAFLQSPLEKQSREIRVLAFDKKSKIEEYIFEAPEGTDKVGDAVALGGKQFLVILSDSKKGKGAKKYVLRVDLSQASNTLLGEKTIHQGQVTIAVDLVTQGFDYSEKAEGLALVADSLVIVNDNDFRMNNNEATEFLIVPWRP